MVAQMIDSVKRMLWQTNLLDKRVERSEIRLILLLYVLLEVT